MTHVQQEHDGAAWRPSAAVVENSNLTAFIRHCGEADFDALKVKAAEDFRWLWRNVIEFFDFSFDEPYRQLVDMSGGVAHAKWCVGGAFNITRECLDKHKERLSKPAIISSDETGAWDAMSYGELSEAVACFAGALRERGIGVGDRVAVLLPMSAHAAVAFMAAARLGAISVPLFSGFGADAIAQRLNHSGAKALITVGAMTRRGQSVAVGATVEQALKDVAHPVDVIVADDHPGTYASWSDAIAHAKPVHDPVRVEADAPLLLVYTSGTTGAPKGAVLTHCGFAAKLSLDVRLCLDLKPADRWLWMSDFGWIIGPIMIASALMTGATLVLAQGAPDYPSPDRFWRLIEDHKVSFLGLAPTLIRGEMAKRELNLREIDLTSLRVVVSSGEPWTHSAWRWCFEQVCNETAPILNWSGGTEISGGILTGTVIEPVKPLAFSTAVPGMGVDVYNGEGSSAAPGEIGELVLTNPSMGLTRGLWDDDQRFLDAYWTDFPDVWKHGDLASRDQDGFFHLHGRSDDVLKIGGKRTGPSEVEDLLVATQLVSDAAVVGLSDDRAGQAIACVCVRADDGAPDEDVSQRLSAAIVDGLGRPYRPKLIGFVDELPKTRSGKVIRRLVSAVLAGRPAGDVSSLANPRSLDAIKALANLSP